MSSMPPFPELDIVTVPYKILMQMPYHQKTEETIKEFDQAWLEFKRAEQR